jgi:tetratricopeptide (TPR) repeat protein
MSEQQGKVGAATAAFSRGDVSACIDIATRGIRDAGAKGSETDAWWFRCLLAQCLGLQGRFQEALFWIDGDESNLQLDMDFRAQLMFQRAFYLMQIGNYALAKATLDRVQSLAEAGSDPSIFSNIHLSKMTLFFYLADYDQMEKSARRALLAAGEGRAALTEAWAASGIGKSFMVRSHFEEAIKWYESAHAIFLRENLPFDAAQMRSELGCCYHGIGDDEKAMEYFSESLKACLDADAMPGYQINLANIGNIHLARGEYAAAISMYQEALEIARKLGDTISVSKWLRNLALTYSHMGNPALAANFQRQADVASAEVEKARAAVR